MLPTAAAGLAALRRRFERGREAAVARRELIGRRVLEIGGIRCATLERALVDAAKHETRIAFGLLPELGIKILEQRPDRAMPAEQEVRGELG